MVVVPKKAFPFMWRKKKTPKVLYLYVTNIIHSLGSCECYNLTSIPTCYGVKLHLGSHDDENANYSGYAHMTLLLNIIVMHLELYGLENLLFKL